MRATLLMKMIVLDFLRLEESTPIQFFKSKNQEVVNLNDCVFDNESKLSTVKSYLQTEKPIVFAQYGYASHIGLKNDGTERIKASKDKIDFIDDVNDVLSPKFLIPFASFCYFCRNENFYL